MKHILSIIMCSAVLSVQSQNVPGTLSYQGILMQSDGITPIAEGAHTVLFKFYTVASGGTAMAGLDRTVSVTTAKGLFSCIIGGGTGLNAPFGPGDLTLLGSQQTYVGITLDGGSELSPRAQLTPSVYAFQAQSAYTISDGAVTTSKIADGAVSNVKLASGIDAAKLNGTINDARLEATVDVNSLNAGSAGQFSISNTGNITKLNNVSVSFPASQGAANSFLTNNGAGVLSWSTTLPGSQVGSGVSAANLSGTNNLPVSVLPTTVPLGNGVNGKVTFWTGTGSVSSNTNFHWDNSNERLGIGTVSPSQKLHVVGNAVVSASLTATSITAGSSLKVANSTVTGNGIAAMGPSSSASGDGALAFGTFADAGGANSVAIGSLVSTGTRGGSFFLGDASSLGTATSSADNQMSMRFAGGYRLFTNSGASIGMQMAAGGNSWSVISDSTRKENFKYADGESVLNKIHSFRLGSWNYKDQDAKLFRHYGPMAQDFFNAFGHDGAGIIGNDTTIASADFDGINLIAIQALEKRTHTLKESLDKIQALTLTMDSMREDNEKLRAEVVFLKGQAELNRSWEKRLSFMEEILKAEIQKPNAHSSAKSNP